MPPCQGELFAKPSSLNPVNPVKNDSASLRLCVKDNLSSAARAVLEAGRELWRYYHAQPNANPNASYYDIRLHFQGVKKTASGREQMNATSSDEHTMRISPAYASRTKPSPLRLCPRRMSMGS